MAKKRKQGNATEKKMEKQKADRERKAKKKESERSVPRVLKKKASPRPAKKPAPRPARTPSRAKIVNIDSPTPPRDQAAVPSDDGGDERGSDEAGAAAGDRFADVVPSVVQGAEPSAASATELRPSAPLPTPPRRKRKRKRPPFVSVDDYIDKEAGVESGASAGAQSGLPAVEVGVRADEEVAASDGDDQSFIDDEEQSGRDSHSLHRAVDRKREQRKQGRKSVRQFRKRRAADETQAKDESALQEGDEVTPAKDEMGLPLDPLTASARRRRRASRDGRRSAAGSEKDPTPLKHGRRRLAKDDDVSPRKRFLAERVRRVNPDRHEQFEFHFSILSRKTRRRVNPLDGKTVWPRRSLNQPRLSNVERNARWEANVCHSMLKSFNKFDRVERQRISADSPAFSAQQFVRSEVKRAIQFKGRMLPSFIAKFEGMCNVYMAVADKAGRGAECTEEKLRLAYGGTREHLYTHEAFGADRSAFIYTEDPPSSSDSEQSGDEQAADGKEGGRGKCPHKRQPLRRPCDSSCDSGILPGAFTLLHRRLRLLGAAPKSSYDPLRLAVSAFEQCSRCDDDQVECALKDCKDTIRLLRHLAPHFKRIRALLERWYSLRHIHHWLWAVDLAIEHSSFRDLLDLLAAESGHLPEKLQRVVRAADGAPRDAAMEAAVIEKYGKQLDACAKAMRDYIAFPCHLCEMRFKQSQLRTYASLAEEVASGANCDVKQRALEVLQRKGVDLKGKVFCIKCRERVQANAVPPLSVLNGFALDAIAEELRCLNAFERPLVQRVNMFHTVLRLNPLGKGDPANRISAFRLNCIHLPMPLQPTVDYLATTLPRLDNITILVHSIKTHLNKVWSSLVDVDKVARALHWLRDNNIHYQPYRIPVGVEAEAMPTAVLVADGGKGEAASSTAPVEPELPIEVETELTEAEAVEQESLLKLPGADYDVTNISVHPMERKLPDMPDTALYLKTKVAGDPVYPHSLPHMDELGFPWLYPRGRGGTDEVRVNVSPSDFVKQRVNNVDARFRLDQAFMFNLAWRKKEREMDSAIFHQMTSSKKAMTAQQLLTGASKGDEELERNITSMFSSVRGANEYWSSKGSDLFAMIDDLDKPPTVFVTLSCAEYKWADMSTFLRLVNAGTPIESLPISRLCAADPVGVAQQFYLRYCAIFKHLIKNKDGPLGVVTDHFWRLEYQARGAPHIHALFWIEGAPVYGEDPDEDVCKFIDSIITCARPDPALNPRLSELVESFQQHNCTVSCLRKTGCRYGFPRAASAATTLNSVEQTTKSRMTGVNRKEMVALRRSHDETNTNNYNATILLASGTNMDIQFIAERSRVVARYVTSYTSKGEKEATREEWDSVNKAKSLHGQMKSFTLRHFSQRQIGAYENGHDLLGYPLCSASRLVKFCNARPKSERVGKVKPAAVVKSLPANSTAIFCPNLYSDYYPKRHDALADLCIYEVCRDYDFTNAEPGQRARLPSYALKEMPGYLKQRGRPAVLKLPLLKRETVEQEERYWWTMLFLFTAWREEETLSYFDRMDSGLEKTFAANLAEGRVRPIYHEWLRRHKRADDARKKAKKLAEVTREKVAAEAKDAAVAEVEEELDDIAASKDDQVPPVPELNDEEAADLRSRMNDQQGPIYDEVVEHVLHVARHNSTPPTCDCGEEPPPLRLCITGVGGTGKSFLINALVRRLRAEFGRVNAVAVVAPTGIAAFNVGGVTCHRFWKLSVQHSNKPVYQRLKRQREKEMKIIWRPVQLIILDEVSLLGNWLLGEIQQRLSDAFDSPSMAPRTFAGMNFVILGDPLQLPPIGKRGQPTPFYFRPCRTGVGLEVDLWSQFDCRELTKNMRHQDDPIYADLCSRARVGSLTAADIELLRTRLIEVDSNDTAAVVAKYRELAAESKDCVCLMPTNPQCAEFNDHMLAELKIVCFEMEATDVDAHGRPLPKKGKKKRRIVKKKASDTAGMEMYLRFGVGARVMLRRNIDTSRGLVNGALGTVTTMYTTASGAVLSVGIKFDQIEGEVKVERQDANFELTSSLLVSRKQFPLILAWAITIHKSQGLTLDRVFADLGAQAKTPGQAYVALSRVRRLSGLHLLDLDTTKIQCHLAAYDEYARVRKECGLPPPLPPNVKAVNVAAQPRRARKVVREMPLPDDVPPPKRARRAPVREMPLPDDVPPPKRARRAPAGAKPAAGAGQQQASLPARVVGLELHNFAQVCWSNALVQLLVRLPGVRNGLAAADAGDVVSACLRELCEAHMNPAGVRTSTERLLKAVANYRDEQNEHPYRHFIDGGQKDVGAFLQALFVCLPAPIVVKFEWLLKEQQQCSSCNDSVEQYEPAKVLLAVCPRDSMLFEDALTSLELRDVGCQGACKNTPRSHVAHAITREPVFVAETRYLFVTIDRRFYDETQQIAEKNLLLTGLDTANFAFQGRDWETVGAVCYQRSSPVGAAQELGHYWAIVKAEQGGWTVCDDTRLAHQDNFVRALARVRLLLLKSEPPAEGGNAQPTARGRGRGGRSRGRGRGRGRGRASSSRD